MHEIEHDVYQSRHVRFKINQIEVNICCCSSLYKGCSDMYRDSAGHASASAPEADLRPDHQDQRGDHQGPASEPGEIAITARRRLQDCAVWYSSLRAEL